MALQFVAQVVIARILGPAQYGVFAVSAVIVGLVAYLADFGIALNLVKRKSLDDADVEFVWTWQVVSGAVVSIMLALAAPIIAAATSTDALAKTLPALALVVLLLALGAPASNLLKRRLDYRTLQVAYIFGYLVGYCGFGISLAIAGWGVWSLVIAWQIQSAVTLLWLYSATRHSLRMRFWHHHAADFFGLAKVVLITNLVNWVSASFDKVIAARYLGVRETGFYTVGFNLVNTPVTALYAPLQSIVLAIGARTPGDRKVLAPAYVTALGIVSFVAFPLSVCAAIAAPEIITALYGREWKDAGSILSVFLLAAPFLLLWGVTTPMLWNTNQARREVQIQLPFAIFSIFAYAAAASFSVLTLAWVAAAIAAARTVWAMDAVRETLGLPMAQLLTSFRAAGVATLGAGAMVWVVRWLACRTAAGPVTILGIEAVASLAGVLLSWGISFRMLDPTARLAIRAALGRGGRASHDPSDTMRGGAN